jgi:hypothetical protein
LLLPSLLLFGLHLRSVWHVENYYAARASAPSLSLTHTWQWLQKALVDFYITTTHDSFFGNFGWMDTPIVLSGPRTHQMADWLIQAATFLTLGLTLLRLGQVGFRLTRVAWRGRLRQSVRIACSNPVLNSYILFTAMMIVLYIRLEFEFHAQGRNWLPLLLPIFVTMLHYAPRAISFRPLRQICSATLAMGLALYVVFGSFYALRTIQQRYYGPVHHQAVHETSLPLTLATSQQISWTANTAMCEGNDPYVVYALPRPQFVHAVRLRFAVNHTSPPHFAILQAWWMQSGRNEFTPGERNSTFRLPTGSHEQTLTLWINDTIDHLRIDPDGKPCQFELREAVLLMP